MENLKELEREEACVEVHESEQFFGKEFTVEDLNDSRQYIQSTLEWYLDENDDESSLIDAVITMVKTNKDSTIEITSKQFNTIIYRNNRLHTKYIIEYPQFFHGDYIEVTKEDSRVFKFTSVRSMQEHFYLQEQIDEIHNQISK